MKFEELIGYIIGAVVLSLFLWFVFYSLGDMNDREETCEDNLGELTSGSTYGCLINDTLHDMTRTKDGWIILNDAYVEVDE